MTKIQAKTLKAGDRVVWTSPGGTVAGVVVHKRYNTIWIRWADQPADMIHYAGTMPLVELAPDTLSPTTEEQQ